jgi:hypothetical protein
MTPRCRDWWEDDVPTCGSKLNKLAEIEEVMVQLSRNPIVLFAMCHLGNAKLGRVAICKLIHASIHLYACIVGR